MLALRTLVVTVLVLFGASVALAQPANWSVSKVSGEVWITSSGLQKAALTSDAVVRPGDDVTTGRNGRVLLVRGEEAILVSPNSAISIPQSSKDGLSTTIRQQKGSALFNVEKRNVKHFEVETPYLAALVKGTEFTVTVTGTGASVRVSHGAVDVTDFKTGAHVIVMPGQSARVSAAGRGGLQLQGPGPRNPILRGTPRVPGGIHAAAPVRRASTRISEPMGDVRLDFDKVTHGLARGQDATNDGAAAARGGAGGSGGGLAAASGGGLTAASGGATASAGIGGGVGGGTAIAGAGGSTGGGSSGLNVGVNVPGVVGANVGVSGDGVSGGVSSGGVVGGVLGLFKKK